MCCQKAVIKKKNAQMPKKMQQDSAEPTTQALEKYDLEKAAAALVKEAYNETKFFDFIMLELPMLSNYLCRMGWVYERLNQYNLKYR
uniref:Uncharacterized protein n=1 Tax=Suricata suricatta TaxID=37032 RepID=A0A673TEP2_SURSU